MISLPLATQPSSPFPPAGSCSLGQILWKRTWEKRESGGVKERVMDKSSTENQRHRAQTHPCTGSAACRASAALKAASQGGWCEVSLLTVLNQLVGMICLFSDDLCSHFKCFFKSAHSFKLVVSLQDSSDFLSLRSKPKTKSSSFTSYGCIENEKKRNVQG